MIFFYRSVNSQAVTSHGFSNVTVLFVHADAIFRVYIIREMNETQFPITLSRLISSIDIVS